MNKRLQELYSQAASWLAKDDTSVSAHDIIESACDILADIPELEQLHIKCCFQANLWNSETLEECVGDANLLVEEISGTLGEYLDSPQKPSHTLSRRKITLRGYDFELYDITFFQGTDREKTVTAASAGLEDFIWNKIEDGQYDKDIQTADEMYGYYVPEGVDTTDDHEIIVSIGDIVYWDEPNTAIL